MFAVNVNFCLFKAIGKDGPLYLIENPYKESKDRPLISLKLVQVLVIVGVFV